MTVIIRNISEDTKARIRYGDKEEVVCEHTQISMDIPASSLLLTVIFERDFRFGIKKGDAPSDLKGALANRITETLAESAGNAVLKLKNTYIITGLTDGAEIELNDRACFVDTNGFEDHFKCIPGLYYFGEAECSTADVKIAASTALNREEFLRFYRCLFRLAGFRRIIRRAVQNRRQKRISSDRRLNKTFTELYSLSAEERDRQFRPLAVIADKAIAAAREKLSNKVFSAVADHITQKIVPSKKK